MKALEMLYRDKKWIEEECDISKIPIERVQTMIKDLVEINEAIAELEALQQPKSCENCISWETGRKTISTCILGVCDGTCFSTKGDFMFEIQVAHGTHKDFCCSEHTPKEQ